MSNISSLGNLGIQKSYTAPVKSDVANTPQTEISDKLSISSKGDEYIPGELLVRFKGKAPENLIPQNKGISAEIVKKFDIPAQTKSQGDLCQVKLDGITVEQALEVLSKDKSIEYVEPNYIYRQPVDPSTTGASASNGTSKGNEPNDLHANLWGLKNDGQTGGTVGADISATEAWKIGTGKREGGALIAVIDTGIDIEHPDLVNNLWVNPGEIPGDGIDNDGNGYIDDVHGFNFAHQTGSPADDQGHGTHCTGTIAAEGNNGQGVVGVNWNAQVMGLKFLGPNYGSTSAAIEAIEYATKMGVDVASNSWGGGPFSNALRDAIAGFPGLFVAAAGNSSSDNDAKPTYPASYKLPNVIAVASTDADDKLSTFSNYGKKSVDIAAPGTKIFSTIPGGAYAFKSGTSMACPHVAGVAGLIMSTFPELSVADVKSAILNGSDKLESLDGEVAGSRRLNAEKALKSAQRKAAKMNKE